MPQFPGVFRLCRFAGTKVAWYPGQVMRAPLPLGRAAIFAALGPLVAVACGSETIDLLPPQMGQEAAGSAGDSAGGSTTSSGAGGNAGASGSAASAGNGGTAVTCFGLGCAGSFNFGGFGGTFMDDDDCNPQEQQCAPCQVDEQCPNDDRCSLLLGGKCVECAQAEHCYAGFSCDLGVGRCAQACQESIDCPEERVCDESGGVCVECLDHFDCGLEERYCNKLSHRCVECLSDDDCGESKVCAGGNCTECYLDKHCDAGLHCDIPRGHCE